MSRLHDTSSNGGDPLQSRQRALERGLGKLTAIVFCSLVGGLVFVAYHVVPFYYYYFELTNQIQALVATADRNNDAAIRGRVMQVIKELEIPAEERDVQIDRRDGRITIAVAYSEIFYITISGNDYDIYRFKFRASAEGAF